MIKAKKLIMPVVNRTLLSKLNQEEQKMVDIILGEDDRINAAKHPIRTDLDGKAAYVWRMLCFYVSPYNRHHCLPICAEFDLPEKRHRERNDMAEVLDAFVDRLVCAVRSKNWHGVRRWGHALRSIRRFEKN